MLPHPATALIATLNHLLQGNDWARKRLAPYAGRQALIGMPPFQVGFVITDAGSVEPVAEPVTPDVTITMPADSPFRLLDGFDRLMGAARVEGNAEFATELSFVFRNLRWDAAEDLSRVFGDVAAQRMVKTTHKYFAWQKQAVSNLFGNLNEYLAFENKILVTRPEFDAFSMGLSQLENTLSRLEQRTSGFDDGPSRLRRLS
jgi:ubiquinone biosynthesis protein UbiJ